MKFWCDSEMLSQYMSPALKLPLLRVLAARASSRRQVIVKNCSDPLHPSGLMVTLLFGAGEDQRCLGVAQHYLLHRSG